MKAIYCVLLSFVCLYIAANSNKKDKSIRTLAGFFIMISFISLIASIIFMIIGI